MFYYLKTQQCQVIALENKKAKRITLRQLNLLYGTVYYSLDYVECILPLT